MHENDYAQMKNNFIKHQSVKSMLIYQNKIEYTEDYTIMMPAYGLRGNYVIDAIKSVINQAEYSIQYSLIIVDNLFTGVIPENIKHLVETARIKILYYQNESNIGMFGNWNRCVELAPTKWVGMIHDDDIIYSTYIANVEKIIKRLSIDEKAVYIKTAYDTIVDNKIKKSKELFYGSPKGKLIKFTSSDLAFKGFQDYGVLGAPTCGTIFCRDLFLSSGGYDESHYPSSDSEVPELLITKYGLHVYKTRESLGAYRWAVNSCLREEEIVGFTEEIQSYAEYYKVRNQASGMMYSLFSKEMMSIFKNAQISHINRVDDVSVRMHLAEVLNGLFEQWPKPNPIKLILMKIIYRIVYLKMYVLSIRY